MNPLSRIAGMAYDRVLGVAGPATEHTVRRDVGTPMPDGVVLLGDHYRPAGATEPLPVVLMRSPYGRAGLVGVAFALPMVRRGFQLFVQSTRGTFGSGGEFRPFIHEHEDGLATIAWLREQPWCDGRISMVGPSYLGHTQWAIAPYVDPPLESVSLNVTAAKITSAFYEHGTPALRNALGWSAQIGRQERGFAAAVPNPRQQARVKKALRKLPLQAADADVAGAPVPFWRDFTEHAAPGDTFWAGVDHQHADFSRMPPASMVTGWWDLFLLEQLSDYAALRAAGVEVRLTIGNWLHGEPAELRAIAQQDIAWLSRHLSGAPAQSGPANQSGPAVRAFLQHGDGWLEFDQWPPPATPTPFYLRTAGGLAADSEPGSPLPAWFVYDPADPTPTAAGPVLSPPGKQTDNADIESRPDVLTYTSDPLTASQDLVGPVSARIFVRTETEHADLFVRLCDVDAAGVSRNIVDGIRRLTPETVPAADVERGDDGVLAVAVELFPTGYRVQAGHRLRLQVAGGAFPRYARNFGTGEAFGSGTRGQPCRFEVFADAEHPSCVVLPYYG